MIDRTFFFTTLREPLFGGVIAQPQVDGCNAILDGWEKWQPDADPRFIAYALATAFHETAQTMQPVVEAGKGGDHAYADAVGPYKQRYYGRGFVQLTWRSNYANATKHLRLRGIIGADLDLERDAELALRPDIAAAVLIYGMIEGWFTGYKLSSCFTATGSDWLDARRIINGLDKAATVARYGQQFHAALTPPAPAPVAAAA